VLWSLGLSSRLRWRCGHPLARGGCFLYCQARSSAPRAHPDWREPLTRALLAVTGCRRHGPVLAAGRLGGRRVAGRAARGLGAGRVVLWRSLAPAGGGACRAPRSRHRCNAEAALHWLGLAAPLAAGLGRQRLCPTLPVAALLALAGLLAAAAGLGFKFRWSRAPLSSTASRCRACPCAACPHRPLEE
jgi:hypothetical protein